MIEILTTTYPKNMINMSFDRHFEVLFNKFFMTKFGDMFTEIAIFEVDAFKSIRNHKILVCNFYRIRSNFDCILNQERNLP